MRIFDWLKQRKTAASITALAVVLATPVTFAVLHEGFPISDVELDARNVWVTNKNDIRTGRLNTQISELNGAVTMASNQFDVMQDGDRIFVHDQAANTVERVDPARVSLVESIEVPDDAQVTFAGSTMAILDKSDGSLWVVDVSGALAFDMRTVEPIVELGAGGQAIATDKGSVFAVSSEQGTLYRVEGVGAPAIEVRSVDVTDYELTTVGDRAVILDRAENVIVTGDGGRIELPEKAVRLQQPGAERDFAVAATGSSLLKVPFAGQAEVISAEIDAASDNFPLTAAPVVLGTCIHGAWVSGSRYLGVCEGQEPAVVDIPRLEPQAELRFRVNRTVIALNNLEDGDSWLVADAMTQVENWPDVAPPEPEEALQGDEKSATQSFAETLKARNEQNNPPIASLDEVGARPTSTTIIAALDNDTDPDGDVLTITNFRDVPESAGIVELIDDGRALQFDPADGASGTVSVPYTISDGRGGVAESQINITIQPDGENSPPEPLRTYQLAIESRQTVTYNVLSDVIDPDGDDLILTSAVSASGDIVRFRPNGDVTFTHSSSDLGEKSVSFVASDGREFVESEFIVDVRRSGELDPVGTPDFASTFEGRPVEIRPLANDRSPSGEQLVLQTVEAIDDGVSATVDSDSGVVTATAGAPGPYYLKYSLSGGAKTSEGLIRVDVRAAIDEPAAPVAVKDTAYLRPNEQTTLAVLANDQSPSGNVIGIQDIALSAAASQLISVEVLSSTVLRITAQNALTSPVDFSYTVSDGVGKPASASVRVVPVPELVKHQAPIAADDLIKVRAGDVASVSVLANDFHPDGARMTLDPVLVEANVGEDGLAFVTGDRVRLQAPSEPGQYSVAYRVFDGFEEAATANVVFTVVAVDEESNTAPIAPPLTARVFNGGSVTVDVPLDGIDPEGDSVVLGSVSGFVNGKITAQTSTSFTYEAYDDKQGTDVFTYEVRDSFGAISSGSIRVGVIERGSTVMAPSAVFDEVSIRPGRVASVPVLANDSDPNGYPIELDPELLSVDPGITAVTDVETGSVIVTAGDVEDTFNLRYSMNNGNAGQDDAFLAVTVAKDAPLQPPTALDHVLEVADIVGQEVVSVNVLEGAQNPGGLVSDLVISTDGVNASAAEVGADGNLEVRLGDTRQAIAYRLTNEIDELDAMAFVIVPAYTRDLPPELKPELVENPPVVDVNGTIEWKIADLLVVPSGREVRLVDESAVTAGRGNGDPIYLDEFTLRFTPEEDFRGTTYINFEVTDGSTPDDPTGVRALIPMTVIVGDPNLEDAPAQFSDVTLQVEAGGAPTAIDLRDSSSHPNPDMVSRFTYSGLNGQTSSVAATLAGSVLSVSAPETAEPGDVATLKFTLEYRGEPLVGEVAVEVVASKRPLAQATEDLVPEGRPSSTYVISPLDNDFDPFAPDGTPLIVVGAEIEGATLGASVDFTEDSVTVRTSSTKSGTISIVYTVSDATGQATREVQGRITVVVASAPEPVTTVVLSNPGTQTVNVVFDPPSSSNGAEITGWTVQIDGAPGTASRLDCLPGGTCQFTGRANGSSQSITVAATNRVGTTWSAAYTITPWGTPATPASAGASNGPAGAGYVNISWAATTDAGGGAARYEWRVLPSGGWNNAGGATSAQPNIGVGNSASFEIRACNDGARCSSPIATNVATAPNPPPRTWVTRSGNTVTYHWSNLDPGSWPEVVSFRCWNVPPNTQSGSVNNVGSVAGSFSTSSGSINVPCGAGVTDNFSVEPWRYGPWLQVGHQWEAGVFY